MSKADVVVKVNPEKRKMVLEFNKNMDLGSFSFIVADIQKYLKEERGLKLDGKLIRGEDEEEINKKKKIVKWWISDIIFENISNWLDMVISPAWRKELDEQISQLEEFVKKHLDEKLFEG